MKITIPAGFELPEGISEGDEFEATITLKLGEDGTATLVALDSVPLESEEDDADKEEGGGSEAPKDSSGEDEVDFESAVMAGLLNGGQG